MFFLKNGRRDNKPPILLLHSYARYMTSSSGLSHRLFKFVTVNIDCHFWFHNIDKDTYLNSESHITSAQTTFKLRIFVL